MEWIKEREQWMLTCRNLQNENYQLQRKLDKASIDKERALDVLRDQLEAKDELLTKMDEQLIRLQDEIAVLNLEITLLRRKTARESPSPPMVSAPSSPVRSSAGSPESFVLCAHFE